MQLSEHNKPAPSPNVDLKDFTEGVKAIRELALSVRTFPYHMRDAFYLEPVELGVCVVIGFLTGFLTGKVLGRK